MLTYANGYARIADNLSRLLSPAVPWKESGERVTVLTLLALLVQKYKY